VLPHRRLTMTSKLRAFEDTVLSVREPREIKGSLICAIQDSDIPTLDKRKLIVNIDRCMTIKDIQRLFYNALLKFEGMGVI
jgi:hypothetical protein